MKKFICIFIFFVSFIISVLAHDIIVTVDSEIIEAFIHTVSDYEVYYKKVTNPNGPTFIMNTSKIASIIYTNGDIQTFQKNANKQNNNEKLFKSGRLYIYGDLYMNDNEYAKYLENNCMSAYKEFMRGCNRIKEAKIMLSLGIALFDVAGVSMTIVGGTHLNEKIKTGTDYNNDKYVALLCVGVASLVAGTALEIACIPTWISGAKQKKSSIDILNESCSKKTKPQSYWSVNITNRGLSFALNF